MPDPNLCIGPPHNLIIPLKVSLRALSNTIPLLPGEHIIPRLDALLRTQLSQFHNRRWKSSHELIISLWILVGNELKESVFANHEALSVGLQAEIVVDEGVDFLLEVEV